MNKKPVDVLLLNPPLSLSQPYISIPILASHLKAENLSVAVSDVNCEFYRRFLTRDNLRRGISYATDRFIELNNRSELRFTDMLEYVICYYNLRALEKNLSKLSTYLLPFSSVEMLKELKIDFLVMAVATLPYFPEILITRPQLLYTSPYYEFSSDEINESTGHSSFYSEIVSEIMNELLDVYDPKIIGISMIFREQVIPGFLMARIIKERKACRHLTIGGTFVSSYMRNLKDNKLFKYVDSFVIDEGEIPIVQLVQEISLEEPGFENIQNLVYVKDGQVCYNKPAEPVDLNLSHPADFNVFPLESYTAPEDKFELLFRTARGCPWQQCTFCRTEIPFCKNFQQPPFPILYDQFVRMVNDTGVKRFFLTAESADPLFLEYFSKRVMEDRLNITWRCHTRVDEKLTKERCELFKASGCETLYLGVESFNDRILKLMRKGITLKLIDRVVRQIGGAVPLVFYLIAGFPGETKQEAMEGFSRLQDYIGMGLVKDYYYSPLQIMRGSHIWRHPEEYGISEFIMPDSTDLESEVNNFVCEGMSREEVFDFVQKYAIPRNRFFPELYVVESSDNRSIHINDEDVEVRFEIAQILRNIDNIWEFSYLTRKEWFSLGEKRTAPIKSLTCTKGI